MGKNNADMSNPTADVAIAQKDIQIAVYAREIEAQAGEIRALRSELGKTKAAADSERAAYDAKMADCRNKVSSLEAEASRIGKTLSEERAAAHAAQERFLSEIESMRKGNADVMARLTAAESGKEALSADKAKLTAENARISEECRAAREALDRSLSDADFLREGNRSLMSRLENAESEKSVLSSANEKLVADNNRLSNELGAARAYGKDQAAKLSAEKTASAQFKQKADSRFAEIASLKAKLKKAQDAEAAARRRADSAERNLSAANRSLRACREREDARRTIKRFHRLVKAVMPYGMVCTWKRMAYGIVEDKPLFYYPGLMKRTRRIAKFLLPYFAVAAFKRAKYGEKPV